MIGWLTRLMGRTAAPSQPRVEPPVIHPAAEQPVGQREEAYDEGMRLFEAGCFDAAADRFEAAIDLKHDWAAAHYQLGLCRLRQGLREDARDAFVMSLCFDPSAGVVRYAMALAERALGQIDDALATVDGLLEREPGHADAHNFRGALVLQRGDVTGAVASFERAVAADPSHAAAHSNLGYLLFRDLGEYERGARHIEIALALQPDNRDARCNYTMVLSQRGEHERALDICDRLLGEWPDMHEAKLNRALVRLKLGRFESGWDDYEARKQVRCNYIARPLPWPEWQGQSLDGKTVLVFGEQGVGDEIMFASCFGDLVTRAGHTVIECAPRLQRLFERSFPRATVVPGTQSAATPDWSRDAPPIDFQLAAGSLPRHFRRHLGDFPAHQGYLVPDPARVRFWRERLATLGPGLKVGLSWRGGMQSTRRTLRSIDLTSLIPLLRVAAAKFVDLQYGDTREELERLSAQGFGMTSWPEAIEDLDETAALISGLDLVVSVCTATIHLAGAVGREAWVMVPSVPEWRYLAQGESMPWYPNVHLFRQRDEDGHWNELIGCIAGRLADRIARSRG